MSTAGPYTRKNPFPARLLHVEVLTRPGSGKDTRHYEIDLSGSGIHYEPGDSLAIQPQNDPALVEEVLGVFDFTGNETIGEGDSATTLYDALLKDYAVTSVDPKLIKAISAAAPDSLIAKLSAPAMKSELNEYLYGREVIDLILEYRDQLSFTPAEFVATLRKLQVRLYSISSSLKAVPEQVHLTVATVQYESFGRPRQGIASAWLAHRVTRDSAIPCFITPNNKFRLPAPENEAPIIMIGPGTGVAPFRAFVQERRATGAKSDAWLFFGEQRRDTEFFYEHEWETALKDGSLTKLSTAFSRDQAHKIYVQHRMIEEGKQLWEWLDKGAIFYVCGDKTRMAADVDEALHKVIEAEGGKSADEAREYVETMKKEHRYHRDVY